MHCRPAIGAEPMSLAPTLNAERRCQGTPSGAREAGDERLRGRAIHAIFSGRALSGQAARTPCWRLPGL
jgi:hypothetical protein